MRRKEWNARVKNATVGIMNSDLEPVASSHREKIATMIENGIDEKVRIRFFFDFGADLIITS